MSKFKEDIIDDCLKINASFLTKNGYFGGNYIGDMIWTLRGKPFESVRIISSITSDDDKPHIRLIYTQTDSETGKKTNFDYKVYLARVNSTINPEKYFYYFICPMTGKRTSVLYKPVSSNMYLHREAYRMFSQKTLDSFSNLEARFGLELENKLSKLKEKLKDKLKSNHKKVPLKLIERVKNLEKTVKKLYVEPDPDVDIDADEDSDYNDDED